MLPVSTLESTESAAAWANVNRSVSFPKVARKILELYQAQTGKRLDGVIGANSIALQYMSTVTGPVRGEGLDLAIGEDSVARVLMHDVIEYFEGRPEARKLCKLCGLPASCILQLEVFLDDAGVIGAALVAQRENA